MARINAAIGRAGWELGQIREGPYHLAHMPTIFLAKPVGGGKIGAEVVIDISRGMGLEVVFHARHALGADRRDLAGAISGLIEALEACPGLYPLTREEHVAQRRKMFSRRGARREPGERDDAGFPGARGGAAGAARAAEEHEPEPGG